MDIRRFGPQYRSRRYARTRALDGYSRYYDIAYPGEVRTAGRPLRTSPAYPRLQELGARFSEKSGWERADWFDANDDQGVTPPAGWAGRFWSPAIRAECLATRDRAGLFDQTSFGKLMLHGPDALQSLELVCANRIDRPVGTVVYTQMLNGHGGIEADVTVTRTAEQAFRLVTGTASPRRDREWIRRHLPAGARVRVDDITGTEVCYCLWGPAAAAILAPMCDDPATLESLGFLRAARIMVAGVPVLVQRVTFVGEHGFELHAAAEFGLTLWDALFAAGQPHGMLPAGYRALDCLRLEKGYRAWGTDLTPVTSPFEAGLGFAVALDKPVAFIGRPALEADSKPERLLRALVLHDPAQVVLGFEAIRAADEVCGYVTSGGYGYRIDASIAYGYLPAELGPGAELEISLFDEWVPARVTAEPLYDAGRAS